MSQFLVLGRIVAPHGVRGAVRVQSFADSPDTLLDQREWRLRRSDGSERTLTVLQAQWDGHMMRAELEGVTDRDAAEALRDSDILVERSALPAPGEHEYFRDDLIGFTVRNLEGVVLGTLQYFLEAPAGALMVVGGERERWLPATPPLLRRVDLAKRELEVDWPADF